MLNFDFKKSSRKCFQSEREFQPGEVFFSALIEVGETAERRDFGAEHWEGPPEDCIGWWKSRVPKVKEGRVYWAPPHVLLAYFEHVCGDEKTFDLAYVAALLLAQKKLIVIEDNEDPAVLVGHQKGSKSSFEIAIPELSPQRLNEIQNELSEKLFMDQPYEEDEPEVDQLDDDA